MLCVLHASAQLLRSAIADDVVGWDTVSRTILLIVDLISLESETLRDKGKRHFGDLLFDLPVFFVVDILEGGEGLELAICGPWS
jgi:hypothetical protein